jgi:uncharacterized protein (TIGR02145 family)
MKKAVLFLIIIGFFFKINAQKNFWDLTDAQLKTNMQRVNSQGSIPPQIRLNFYSDKMNIFFIDNLWEGDNILSIKELQVSPPDDPSDWYYFVSIKTKLCATPFYCNYDIGDRVLGELFMWDTRIFPKEFIKHVDSINAKIEADKKAAAEKERKERVEEEKRIEDQKITDEMQVLKDNNRIDSLMNQQGLTKIKDIDGNEYRILSYGEFDWMIDNLKTKHFNNGDEINTCREFLLFDEKGPFQWACNGNETNVATYGRLYTWYAVTDSRNLCPAGWHVPFDLEWTIFVNLLGGESIAGGKLKETGTAHWRNPNTGATNEAGFTALPGGELNNNGNYLNFRRIFKCWSSSEGSASDALFWGIEYQDSTIYRDVLVKNSGLSVRCIRDKNKR